jgi:hypothetical protein
MVELACPESCQYLASAREQAQQREHELYAKEMAASPVRVNRDYDRRVMTVVYAIDGAIVRMHRGVDGQTVYKLLDSEIVAALENAARNLETESAGLIYEHRAPSPRVREASLRIRKAMDEAGSRDAGEVRPRREEMAKALGFVRERVEAHMRREGDPESMTYLRYVSLFFPWPEETARPLIITEP